LDEEKSRVRGVWLTANTYKQRYREYLLLRGYDPESNKWSILKRALIESWAEPGFHRFWKVWNPGIGYLLFRLYLLLGGKQRRTFTTLVVFGACGLLHDVVVMMMFRHPFLVFSCAFLCFGFLTMVSRSLETWFRQDRWLTPANVAVNVSLVGVSIQAGVTLQQITFP
jgi:hypothetical protein